MILIGSEYVEYPPFVRIARAADLDRVPADCVAVVSHGGGSFKLAGSCKEAGVRYSVEFVSDTYDILSALVVYSNLGVAYVICRDLSSALRVQKVCDSYLLDCKALLLVSTTDEVSSCAEHGVDGAIFGAAFRGLPSSP